MINLYKFILFILFISIAQVYPYIINTYKPICYKNNLIKLNNYSIKNRIGLRLNEDSLNAIFIMFSVQLITLKYYLKKNINDR